MNDDKTGKSPTSAVSLNKPPKIVDAVIEKPQMSFFDALKKVSEGKRITKLEWNSPQNFGWLKNGLLMLHKPDGRDYQWIISDGDLLGTDYIIVNVN